MKKFSNDASMSNCSKWKECDKLENYLQYTPKIQVFVRRKSVLIGHYRIAVDMKHENINFGYNKLKSHILKWYYLSMSSDSGRAEMEGYGKLNSNGTSLNSPHAGFLPLHPESFNINYSWGIKIIFLIRELFVSLIFNFGIKFSSEKPHLFIETHFLIAAIGPIHPVHN